MDGMDLEAKSGRRFPQSKVGVDVPAGGLLVALASAD